MVKSVKIKTKARQKQLQQQNQNRNKAVTSSFATYSCPVIYEVIMLYQERK